MMELDGIDIKDYLPHRAPMLMVDRLQKLDHEIVETVFEIKPDNLFVQNGSFNEPGLIENAAQTCAAIVAKGYFLDESDQIKKDVAVIGFISAIKTLKIHATPLVGQTITTLATFVSKFVTDDYTLCTMGCKTTCNDTVLLEGEINLFIQEQAPISQ
ncbi:ABC transporter permease [Flavobacterium caeni]|uniref:Predicted 3-hydroxylacyl-ACP dehydratase, HotDog domain n=1 Tax=Flavobacterium caeni TaxID=490189 RepID=A0A1G5H4X6_9FLAO|nr:ABC transporter permease [Flavobacterium caeni]SCY58925.1 Predicted 3-hydroxylacyl-ACP dehydratase, HotDog domain [Flavobacterium caeni]